jgi:hypothetical protein
VPVWADVAERGLPDAVALVELVECVVVLVAEWVERQNE